MIFQVQKKEKNIVYYNGKILPFQTGFFDSIISSEVFEHVVNIEEIMKELNRVLKKGGYMLLTVPFVYPRHCWSNDYRRYTYEGIKHLVSENGFEIIECTSNSGYLKSLFELANIYLYERGQNPVTRVLIGINNICGELSDIFLPASDSIYLDNIVLARKINVVD